MATLTQATPALHPGVFMVNFEDISMARDIKKAISMVRGVTKVCKPRTKRISISRKEAVKDPTLMTKEEFLARVERAEEQLARGEGITFTDREAMNAWLNSL